MRFSRVIGMFKLEARYLDRLVDVLEEAFEGESLSLGTEVGAVDT